MVYILDGNSAIGAHIRSNLCSLIGLRHLIRSRAVTNPTFYPKTPIFLHTCASYSEIPSYICTMNIESYGSGSATLGLFFLHIWISNDMQLSVVLILDGSLLNVAHA